MINEIMRNVIYIIPIITLAIPFAIIHVLVKNSLWKKEKREYLIQNAVAELGLIMAVIFVISLTIGRNIDLSLNWQTVHRNIMNNMNLKPFVQIFFDTYLLFMGSKNHLINVLGNIVMFIPVGFGLGLYFKDAKYKEGKVLLTLSIFSLVIESMQILVFRAFDVNDIVLNVVGGRIGYLIFSYFLIRYKTLRSINIREGIQTGKKRMGIVVNWCVYITLYIRFFVNIIFSSQVG